MPSLNQVLLIGHLGKDPDLRHTQGGRAVCNFSIATSEVWTDNGGERHEKTQWHNIVAWGKMAESCHKYLAKGRMVFVEGALQTRSYEDKGGSKRYVTEILARAVKFLTPGGKKEPREETPPEDDVPF